MCKKRRSECLKIVTKYDGLHTLMMETYDIILDLGLFFWLRMESFADINK